MNELINNEKHGPGWFYYTVEKGEERTCLSSREQETALKILEEFNFIEKKCFGLPSKRHFKINELRILAAMGFSNNKSSYAENAELDLRKTQNFTYIEEPHKEPQVNTGKDDSFVVAPQHKISKNKKEKKPVVIRLNHEIPELRIETSDEHHAKLLEKFGQVFTQQCYEELQNWKISKNDSNGKMADHTDYFRILDWVAERIKKKESAPNGGVKTTFIERIKANFKDGKKYDGAECFIDNEGIGFQRGMTHMQVKFKEFGFKDQFESMLRKFGIPLDAEPTGKLPKYLPNGTIIED
jgi:hypothetical protein